MEDECEPQDSFKRNVDEKDGGGCVGWKVKEKEEGREKKIEREREKIEVVLREGEEGKVTGGTCWQMTGGSGWLRRN